MELTLMNCDDICCGCPHGSKKFGFGIWIFVEIHEMEGPCQQIYAKSID